MSIRWDRYADYEPRPAPRLVHVDAGVGGGLGGAVGLIAVAVSRSITRSAAQEPNCSQDLLT